MIALCHEQGLVSVQYQKGRAEVSCSHSLSALSAQTGYRRVSFLLLLPPAPVFGMKQTPKAPPGSAQWRESSRPLWDGQ